MGLHFWGGAWQSGHSSLMKIAICVSVKLNRNNAEYKEKWQAGIVGPLMTILRLICAKIVMAPDPHRLI